MLDAAWLHAHESREHGWDHALIGIAHLAALGIRTLGNEHVVLQRGDARIALAGVNDPMGRHLDFGPDPQRAAAGTESAHLKILLAHNPRIAPSAARAGFDLQLSGHTHAGQFFPWNYAVRHVHAPHFAGLSREGRMWVYVSAGTGSWGPPMRFGTREALLGSARWRDPTDLPDADRIHAWLRAQPGETAVVSEKQDASAAPAVRRLEATFTKRYVAHASLGPSCAVAEMKAGWLRVWSHTQGVYPLRDSLAAVLKLDPQAVVVEHVEGAGCYGHNGADDVAFDAVLLARAAGGRPVRMQWSREDELAWSPMGAAMAVEIEADLDAQGEIVGWRGEVWSNGHVSRAGRAPIPTVLAASQIAKPFDRFIAFNPPMANGGGAERNLMPPYNFPAWNIVCNRLLVMPIRTSAVIAWVASFTPPSVPMCEWQSIIPGEMCFPARSTSFASFGASTSEPKATIFPSLTSIEAFSNTPAPPQVQMVALINRTFFGCSGAAFRPNALNGKVTENDARGSTFGVSG